jgi:putative SOS response-associated peptidase YedK
MCTRYIAPATADIERQWQFTPFDVQWPARDVFPRASGFFVRADPAQAGKTVLVSGQWGLIPWFAKEPKVAFSTHNARLETAPTAASFKQPWARAQRCLIPAWTFFEPCWETGRNVWWGFSRADKTPWALAGLWNTWTDKATGELVESYTMLTMNADAHPLMRRMHKPDPTLADDQQDKRSVIALEPQDWQQWLCAPIEEAAPLLQLSAPERFVAQPLAPAPPPVNTPRTKPPEQPSLLGD